MTDGTSETPVVLDARPARVTVVDFDMPFMSIVLLLVKWALAAIPAALIVGFLILVVMSLFAGMTGVHF